jgi:hypothetical protein
MKDLSKDVVSKIKEDRIVPEPRFRSEWKSHAFWLLMGLMVLVGALSLSLAIFNVSDLDPRLAARLGLWRFVVVLTATAPYLWIALSFLALALGVRAFRNTSRGYRASALFVTSLVVLAISVLGVAGHALKLDRHMGGMLSRNAPPRLGGLFSPGEGRWLRPGDGLIGGEVTDVRAYEFMLKSFDGEEWKIAYGDDTERRGPGEVAVGSRVGVVGERVGEREIRALSIKVFPADWNGKPPKGSGPHGGPRFRRDGHGASPLGAEASE